MGLCSHPFLMILMICGYLLLMVSVVLGHIFPGKGFGLGFSLSGPTLVRRGLGTEVCTGMGRRMTGSAGSAVDVIVFAIALLNRMGVRGRIVGDDAGWEGRRMTGSAGSAVDVIGFAGSR